uniref:CSON005244 protein n=1 Tax=Culicoides sonorensis TaxID=179676 RepID=A0A336MV93_CULSO
MIRTPPASSSGAIRKSTRNNLGHPPKRFPDNESESHDSLENDNQSEIFEQNSQKSFHTSKTLNSLSSKTQLDISIQKLKEMEDQNVLETELAKIKAQQLEDREKEIRRKLQRSKEIQEQQNVVDSLLENQNDIALVNEKNIRTQNWIDQAQIPKAALLKPTKSWHGNLKKKDSSKLSRSSSIQSIENKQESVFNYNSYQKGKEQNDYCNQNEVLLAAFKALQTKQIRDLPAFNGENILDWPIFVGEYERSTKEFSVSNEVNWRRLDKALSGIARETVQALLLNPDNVSQIIKTLEMNFGRSEWIIVKLMNDLRSLPIMKEEGIEQFRTYYNKINCVINTVKSMNANVYIDSPDLLNCMEEKLPLSSRNYWIRYKAELLRNKQKVNLEAFGEWFKYELDAQYAGITFKDIQKKQNNQQFIRKAHVYSISNNDVRPKGNYCIKCKTTGHNLEECKEFKDMNVYERRQLALRLNICFLCLGRSHTVKTCAKKERIGKCSECQSYHNKLLHLDREENTFHVNDANNVLLRIGEVKLKGPKGIKNFFAFFDEGSTASMIDEKIAEELGLSGPKSSITYRWTNEIVRTDYDSMLINTEIAGPHENAKFYELSNVRTVKNLCLPHQKLNVEHIMKIHPYVDRNKLDIWSYSSIENRTIQIEWVTTMQVSIRMDCSWKC